MNSITSLIESERRSHEKPRRTLRHESPHNSLPAVYTNRDAPDNSIPGCTAFLLWLAARNTGSLKVHDLLVWSYEWGKVWTEHHGWSGDSEGHVGLCFPHILKEGQCEERKDEVSVILIVDCTFQKQTAPRE